MFGIKKRLHKIGKNKSCENLQKWTKSRSNHFQWACATCKGDKELLREKWLSVLFHVQNIYKWRTGKQFKRCEQHRLTNTEVKSNDCLNADFEEFKALQKIVNNKKH